MYQKVNSSIVSKGAMKSFNERFPLARMFPLAVMHRGDFHVLINTKYLCLKNKDKAENFYAIAKTEQTFKSFLEQ